MKTLDEIRELFIEVKKEHFTVYIENEDKFTNEKTRELSICNISASILYGVSYFFIKYWLSRNCFIYDSG